MDETQDNDKIQEKTKVTVETDSEPVQSTNANTEVKVESTENEHGGEVVFGAIGGSEETFDILCQQCLEEEKHAEAAMYCTECEEYLCKLCVNMHRKVRLTKAHTLISKDADGESFGVARKNMREPCSLHIEQYLDYFCSNHHSACCLICKSTFHDKCLNVTTLTTAINTISFEQRVKHVVTELEKAKVKLRATICQRQSHIETLEEDKTDSLQALESVGIDVNKAVESLKRLLLEDKKKIEKSYKEIRENFESDIDKRKKIDDSVTASIDLMTNDRFNDEYKFVHLLKAESSLKAIEETLTVSLDDTKFEKIKYERDLTLNEKLQALDTLGHTDSEKAVYTVSLAKQIKILDGTEKKSKIVGMCLIDDQTLLLADWHNCCLKVLDTTDNIVKQSLRVDDSPFDICKIGEEKKFAVTLLHGREVKMFSVSGMNLVSASGSFQTGEKCRGIAYFNSKFYVACGGGGTNNEGHGHVRVYGLDGKLLESILHDSFSRPIVSIPWKIRFQPHTELAFLTDENKILMINMKSHHEILSFVMNCRQKGSFCFDQAGHIFLTNYGSTSVDILSTDGKRRTPLLTNKDLTDKPREVVFDKKNSRLYVALENSTFLLCFNVEAIEWINPPSF